MPNDVLWALQNNIPENGIILHIFQCMIDCRIQYFLTRIVGALHSNWHRYSQIAQIILVFWYFIYSIPAYQPIYTILVCCTILYAENKLL